MQHSSQLDSNCPTGREGATIACTGILLVRIGQKFRDKMPAVFLRESFSQAETDGADRGEPIPSASSDRR